MKEQLVSFETAKLAKEKGFNICCSYASYNNLEELYYHSASNYEGGDSITYEDLIQNSYSNYPASTQSLLQKWFRDIHNIHINITRVYAYNKTPAIFVGWNIYIGGKDFETDYEINNTLISKYFSNYEEALEVGLLEALKLI